MKLESRLNGVLVSHIHNGGMNYLVIVNRAAKASETAKTRFKLRGSPDSVYKNETV